MRIFRLFMTLVVAGTLAAGCGTAALPQTQPQAAAQATQAPTTAPASPTLAPQPTVAPTPAITSTAVPATPAPTKPAAATSTPVSATATARPAVSATKPAATAVASPTKPAATPASTQQPASGAVDCGTDLSCFIEASRAGRVTTVSYTMAADFLGAFLANTDTLAVTGKDGAQLVFSQRTTAAEASVSQAVVDVAKAKGMTEADLQKALTTGTGIIDLMRAANATLSPDVAQRLISLQQTQKERIGTGKECKFPQQALTAMLERWQQGKFSSSDYDSGTCTDLIATPAAASPTPSAAASTTPSASPATAPTKQSTPSTTTKPNAGPILGKNLVVNGDAETGPAAERDTVAVPPQGWTVTGNLTAVKWGTDGVLREDDPGPADRGSAFFAGGPNNEESSASQVIDVAAGAAAIDASTITYDLEAYLGGFLNQHDSATVTATFRSADQTPLGVATLGPSKPEERSKESGMGPYVSMGSVPRGTRSIEISLLMKRYEGAYNDAYADNISLVLAQN